METLIFTSNSTWGQGQAKVRSNKVRSPNTIFSFWSMSILFSFAPGFRKSHLFWFTTIINAQKLYFKNIKKIVTALLRNPCAHVKFFSTARCAGDTESSDIEATDIASIVFPLLIWPHFGPFLYDLDKIQMDIEPAIVFSGSYISLFVVATFERLRV